MAKRLDKTLADYVVGGVMPALLIGLLCSLCYFLLELAYSGAFMGQLKWILFFFIVGTVLIARISMRGDISERAGIYGICLAIAAGLAMVRFVDIPKSALGGFGWLIPFSLMSIIWWSAHKLTQDSTWDDDEDDDGGGLLDTATKVKEPEQPKNKSADWFDSYQSDRQEEQRRKKPGLMVVYFSLAALPLFGVGQAMIPATNIEGRRYAFWMLTIYVACGLGLLLTTSFLGLRRYLRGRRLQMPASMTGLWLGLGSAMIVALMVLSAVLLPRPEAEYHLSQLMNWATSKEHDANDTHFIEGGGGKSDKSGPGQQNKQQQAKAGGQQQGKAAGNQRGRQQQGNQANAQQDPNGQPGNAGQKSGGNQGQSKAGQGKSGQGGQGQGNSGQGKQGQGKQQGKSQQGQQGEGSKEGKQGQGDGGNQKSNQAGKGNNQEKNNQPGGKEQGKDGENGKDQQGETDQQGEQEQREEEKRQAAQGNNRQEEQNQQGNQGKQQEQHGAANNPPPPQPQQQPPPSSASWDWLKWIGYGLMLAGLLFALWKWGRQLWLALQQMWREVLAWWQGLLPKREDAVTGTEIPNPESNLPPRPFAWFSNPLHNPGNFQSMDDMVRYSFAALHSWAYEQNMGRQPDETPTEFAQRLGQSIKHAHQDIRKLADLYSVVTYARVSAPTSSESILRNFWARVGA